MFYFGWTAGLQWLWIWFRDSLTYLPHGWANLSEHRLPAHSSFLRNYTFSRWLTNRGYFRDVGYSISLSTPVINYSLIKIVNLQHSNNNPILAGNILIIFICIRFRSRMLATMTDTNRWKASVNTTWVSTVKVALIITILLLTTNWEKTKSFIKF